MYFASVIDVWDYYDAPRSGVAIVNSEPCYFQCEWDDEADDYAQTYRTHLMDAESLALCLEQRGIFREWERAFHEGGVGQETHPGNPGQNLRYADLRSILDARTKALPCTGRYTVTFRLRPEQAELPRGTMRELEALWQPVV